VERRSIVHQFHSADIDRLCKGLNCSRAELAGRLGVTRACVSQWAKGKRVPQQSDAARIRQLLGEEEHAVNVFELRQKLGMTQRVFGVQFGVSRQQVQKWEGGKATPQRSHLDKLVKRRSRVVADTNALGYFGYAYYLANKDRLKTVAIDSGHGCVSPSPQTVEDNSYQPLSRPLACPRPPFAPV
jgi:DNA-binding transcriptional regulator YiaG